MQYDNYDLKMQKVARFFRTLLRHLPKIIVSAAVLTAAVVTLLATKGIVTVGAEGYPTEIAYGDELQYSATAFLGKVDYEYTRADSDEWTRDFPKEPGEYKVRAVAKATIGYRYGEEAHFSIHKRPVCLKIAEEIVIYGENPKIDETVLVNGDTVSNITFRYNDERTLAEAESESIVITDENGNDVTSRYDISTEQAVIATAKRPITVETLSASKIYDGSALTNNEYGITASSLAEGDRISAVYGSSVTNVGSVKNQADFTVLRADGKDISHFYDVTVNFGELKVTHRPTTVSTGSDSYTYDGLYHSNEEFTCDGLVSGHSLIPNNWAQVKNAGAFENKLSYNIYDEIGNNVTANYDVDGQWGTLTVNKLAITVSTEDYSNTYTGISQSNEVYDISVGELAYGDSFSVRGFASITDVGSVENTVDFRIIGADGDVTDNYEISRDFGTLSLIKRPITVTAQSCIGANSLVYNGFEQFADSITLGGEGIYPASKHYTEIVEKTYFTDAGDYENVLKIIIRDSAKRDVTSNYDITYEDGYVTVEKRVVKVFTDDSLGIVYDDNSHTNTNYTTNFDADFADGHWLDIKESSSIRYVGSCENEFTSYVIRDAEGNEISENNYDIRFFYGTLEVVRRPVIITTGSDEKIYDATPLTKGWVVPKDSPYKLIDGHTVKGTITGTQTNAGFSSNTYSGEVIIESEEINDNYEIIEIRIGTLNVLPRPITVITPGGTFIYDDTNKSPSTLSFSGDYGLCDGHIFAVIQKTSFINVSDSGRNIVKIRIIQGTKLTDEDVTKNYEISYEYGEVTIKPRPITVKTEGIEKIYDAQEFYNDTLTVVPSDVKEYGLCGGHGFEVISAPVFKNVIYGAPNDVDYIIYKTVDGEIVDVTPNYDITPEIGWVTILPRPITVQTQADEIIYDGESHMFLDTTLVDGEYDLCGGHIFEAIDATEYKYVSDSGKVNEIAKYIITDINASGEDADVTANYEVTWIKGIVYVNKRSILIETEGGSWVYDGEAHSLYEYQVMGKYNFVSFHTVVIDEARSASIKDVGYCDNKLEFNVYDGEEDVTENYDISMGKCRKLEVTARSITIGSVSDQKVYDGAALENHSLETSSQSPYEVVDWHKITADFTGTITNVGTQKNTYDRKSVKIFDGSEDVTDNYVIDFSADGDLTVTPREIILSSASAQKKYDGTPLTAHSFKIDKNSPNGLVSGHNVTADFTGEITEVGSTPNTYDRKSVEIYDASGNPVTQNYSITFNEGTLTIRDNSQSPPAGLNRDGKIQGGGNNGDSDGDGDIQPSFAVVTDTTGRIYLKALSFGSYAGDGWEQANEYTLLMDDELSAYYLTAFALDKFGASRSTIRITSYTGEYVAPYYTSAELGDIQLSDTEIIGDATDEYVLYFFNWEYESGMTIPDALSEFEAEYYGFVCENYLDLDDETRSYMQSIIDEQGFSLDDPNVIAKVAEYIQSSAKYNLEYDSALDFESNIVVAFLSEYKEGICQHYASAATLLYRALGLPARYTMGYVADVTEPNAETIVTGMDAHAWVEVYIRGLGWIKVEVTGASDGNGGGNGNGNGNGGEDGGENDGGEGNIPDDGEDPEDKETIVLKPKSAVKEYDGTPLIPNGVEYDPVLEMLLEQGFTYEIFYSAAQTEIGECEVYVTDFILKAPDGSEFDTSQFNIVREPGTLRVIKEAIKILLPERTFDYDGTEHSYYEGSEIKEDIDYYVLDMPDGVTLEILAINISLINATGYNMSDITAQKINVNLTDSSAEYKYISYIVRRNSDGKDVTSDYSLLITNLRFDGDYSGSEVDDYTVMSVRQRGIRITTGSAQKVDDDEPLTYNSYYISQGSILTELGHKLEIEVIGEQTGVGESKNIIDEGELRILDKDGKDVTQNYSIEYSFGNLIITEN